VLWESVEGAHDNSVTHAVNHDVDFRSWRNGVHERFQKMGHWFDAGTGDLTIEQIFLNPSLGRPAVADDGSIEGEFVGDLRSPDHGAGKIHIEAMNEDQYIFLRCPFQQQIQVCKERFLFSWR